MVNAFWLDRDLEQAARWLVDRHVASSVFECSMVLTTAAQLNGYPEDDALYYSHPEHPLTRWAARSHENWSSLREYVDAAHEEWRYRWDHGPEDDHGCWTVVRTLEDSAVADLDWPERGRSDPPQVTTGRLAALVSRDRLRSAQPTGDWSADDYVDAYRSYYANEKRHLFEWSKDRSAPPWVPEYTVEQAEQSGDGEE